MGPTNIKWVQSYISGKCMGFVLFYKVRPVYFQYNSSKYIQRRNSEAYFMKIIVKNHEKYIKNYRIREKILILK